MYNQKCYFHPSKNVHDANKTPELYNTRIICLNSYHYFVQSHLNYSKTLLWYKKTNFRKASCLNLPNSSFTYKTLIYKCTVRLILVKLLNFKKTKPTPTKGLGRKLGHPQRKQINEVILQFSTSTQQLQKPESNRSTLTSRYWKKDTC